ncbi:MAG: hypothetical protein ABIQ16_14580 [Polyangiaceae bacterium]
MVLTSRTFRYLLAAVGIGILFLVCCTQADARSPFWRPRPAPPPYSFTVEDENGNSLPTFVKDGRTFVLGEPGLRYNVRVQNPTGQRVEAVVSVDGRDAMSGQPGDYVRERGYVIPAYGSLLVEGFRKSFEEVAAFRFTSPEDSYSARRGTPENVGVIGVAFFPERARPKAPVMRRPTPRPAPLPYDYYGYNRSRDSARAEPSVGAPAKRPPASSASSAPSFDSEGRDSADLGRREAKGASDPERALNGSVNNLGTQFGETRESFVTSVAFERALPTHPALVATLRYDDAGGLTARGIELSPSVYRRQGEDDPQPFPVSRFAKPLRR